MPHRRLSQPPGCALVPLTTCEEKLGSASSILASLPDCMPMTSLQRFNKNEEGAEKKEHQDSTAMLPEKNQELPMSTFRRLAPPSFGHCSMEAVHHF
jgi:hypothetical protein